MNINIRDFVNNTETDSEFIVEEGGMDMIMFIDPAYGGKTVDYRLSFNPTTFIYELFLCSDLTKTEFLNEINKIIQPI